MDPLEATYSPPRLERLRAEVERLRAGRLISSAVRERGDRREVRLGRATLDNRLREMSKAQRTWETLLAAAAGGEALPEQNQEQLLNLLDLGLALIRRVQAAREKAESRGRRRRPAGGRPGGGGGGGRSRAAPEEEEEQQQQRPPPPPASEREPPLDPEGEEEEQLAPPLVLGGQPGGDAPRDPGPPSSSEEDSDSLDAQDMQAIQAVYESPSQVKVEVVEDKWLAFTCGLQFFISKEILTLEKKAGALWEAWFPKALGNIPPGTLSQEMVHALKSVLPELLWNSPILRMKSGLERMEALQEERGALWKTEDVGYVLWEIQRGRRVYLWEVVKACRDALCGARQEEVDALRKKLEATWEVLKAAAEKERNLLSKMTNSVLSNLVNFPSPIPFQEGLEHMLYNLQDIPLKAILPLACLQEKLRALWGVPQEIITVWRNVDNLELFLWDESEERLCSMQESMKALREEMGAQEEKFSPLWGFLLDKLVVLQDKLNGLEGPLKDTVSARQQKHNAPREEQTELPEKEADVLRSTPVEEIMEADRSEGLPACKNPCADCPVSMPNVPLNYRTIPQELIQRNLISPENADLGQTLTQLLAALQQGQVPSAAFLNSAAIPGLQNGQLSRALATQPSLQQLRSVFDVLLSKQHQSPLGINPPQPAVPSWPLTSVSLGITPTPVAHSIPDVDQMQRTPVEQTADNSVGSNAGEAVLCGMLAATCITPGSWHSKTGHGTLSATQEGDYSKKEQMINLNVDHEISVTSNHPDGHGKAKGQSVQETEELTWEDFLETLLASPKQAGPELASSEPPEKKQKMDALHSS